MMTPRSLAGEDQLGDDHWADLDHSRGIIYCVNPEGPMRCGWNGGRLSCFVSCMPSHPNPDTQLNIDG